MTRAGVRTEIAAGRWLRAGTHTVVVGTGPLSERARRWQAVWESGPGAVLDGVSALHAAGLTGFTQRHIDVTVSPVQSEPHGRRSQGEAAPRCGTDGRCRHPQGPAGAGDGASSRRRVLLDAVISDVCDGAHSLGELDFARMCRDPGPPPPSRQVLRTGPGGRVHLDVAWEDIGLVVEIDGGHHALALNPVDDAHRQNEVTLSADLVLRVPVLGLRLTPDVFMGQVVRAHAAPAGAGAS